MTGVDSHIQCDKPVETVFFYSCPSPGKDGSGADKSSSNPSYLSRSRPTMFILLTPCTNVYMYIRRVGLRKQVKLKLVEHERISSNAFVLYIMSQQKSDNIIHKTWRQKRVMLLLATVDIITQRHRYDACTLRSLITHPGLPGSRPGSCPEPDSRPPRGRT